MRLYKYQLNFLILFSHFGYLVVDKKDMMEALSEHVKTSSPSFAPVFSHKISDIVNRGLLRRASKQEVKKSGIHYDGRKTYLTVGIEGQAYLDEIGIKDNTDSMLSVYIAKKLLEQRQ
jgi:hypothetical protein